VLCPPIDERGSRQRRRGGRVPDVFIRTYHSYTNPRNNLLAQITLRYSMKCKTRSCNLPHAEKDRVIAMVNECHATPRHKRCDDKHDTRHGTKEAFHVTVHTPLTEFPTTNSVRATLFATLATVVRLVLFGIISI